MITQIRQGWPARRASVDEISGGYLGNSHALIKYSIIFPYFMGSYLFSSNTK
jgi:hypothetical protein